MTVEHTFHKFLVAGLLIYVLLALWSMSQLFGVMFSLPQNSSGYQLAALVPLLNSIGSFLLSVAMLYFVPRFVRKFLMEDS